jgi:hypothetical protein
VLVGKMNLPPGDAHRPGLRAEGASAAPARNVTCQQVCLDGAWVAERGNGMQASDLGASQLRFNVAAQAEVTSAVFAVSL